MRAVVWEDEKSDPPKAVWSGQGNLTDVAFEGKCIVHEPYDSFWRNNRPEGKPYWSEVLESPTWSDLMTVATECIEVTADWHHVFLEDIQPYLKLDDLVRLHYESQGITVLRLFLGS